MQSNKEYDNIDMTDEIHTVREPQVPAPNHQETSSEDNPSDYKTPIQIDHKMASLVANELAKDVDTPVIATPPIDIAPAGNEASPQKPQRHWVKFALYMVLALQQALIALAGPLVALFSINVLYMSLSLLLAILCILVPIRAIHFMVRTGFDFRSWAERLSFLIMLTPLIAVYFYSFVALYSGNTNTLAATVVALRFSWLVSPIILLGYIIIGRSIASREHQTQQSKITAGTATPSNESVQPPNNIKVKITNKSSVIWVIAALPCIAILISVAHSFLPTTYSSKTIHAEVSNRSNINNTKVDSELATIDTYLTTTYHEQMIYESVEVTRKTDVVFKIDTTSIKITAHPQNDSLLKFQVYHVISGDSLENDENGQPVIRDNYLAKRAERQFTHNLTKTAKEIFGPNTKVEVSSPTWSSTKKQPAYSQKQEKLASLTGMYVKVIDARPIDNQNIHQHAENILKFIQKSADKPYSLRLGYTAEAVQNSEKIKAYQMDLLGINNDSSSTMTTNDILKKFTREIDGNGSRQRYNIATGEFQ